jgi:methyl-accepting chemotaxis protein
MTPSLVPGFIRRRYPVKFGLALLVLGALVGGVAVTVLEPFYRPYLLAGAGGYLVSTLVGTVIAGRTAGALDALAESTSNRAAGDDDSFETGRVDALGRLAAGVDDLAAAKADAVDRARTLEATAEGYERALRDAPSSGFARRLDPHDEAGPMHDLATAANVTLEEAASVLEDKREAAAAIECNQAKAREYSEVMEACADGDLSRRLDPDAECDAMQRLAHAFNDMLAELEATVGGLKNFADEVATYSHEVRLSTEEVRDGSEQVTSSLRDISERAADQNDNLQSAALEMNRFSTTIQEIASSSTEVADLSQRTAETGRTGREAAREAIEGMNQIEDESEDTVEEIERLAAEVEQIDELIDFITEIAEQTNMLALNANIEASRAGEYGQGFAAVAREIKELAEGTKEAAEDIEQRLARIQSQTDRAVSEVRETSERISDNTASVENAAQALDEIANYAQETNAGVQQISETTEQQVDSTKEVVDVVEDAAQSSEETTTESESVAAAAEAQTMALAEVSASAKALATQATRLSEALQPFETETAREFAPSPADEARPADDETETDEQSDSPAFDFETLADRTDEPGDEETADLEETFDLESIDAETVEELDELPDGAAELLAGDEDFDATRDRLLGDSVDAEVNERDGDGRPDEATFDAEVDEDSLAANEVTATSDGESERADESWTGDGSERADESWTGDGSETDGESETADEAVGDPLAMPPDDAPDPLGALEDNDGAEEPDGLEEAQESNSPATDTDD